MATLADYRKRPHYSYSSINSFVNVCSLQWGFRYAYKLEPAFTPVSLVFGNTFHRVCENVYWCRKDCMDVKASDAGNMFRDLWARQLREEDNDIQYAKSETEDSLGEQGKLMAEALVNSLDDSDSVSTVNMAFSVPLICSDGESLEKPLIGEIDCVLERDGMPVILDWKTAARKWPKDKADKDLQPTAFCGAYSQVNGVNPAFEFEVITKTKSPSVSRHPTTRSEDDFLRLAELAKMVEAMSLAEHFLPNEQSFFCGGCQYQEACMSWHHDRTKLISIAA